jgi:diguanylate cyclase (GGDEF)-like protein
MIKNKSSARNADGQREDDKMNKIDELFLLKSIFSSLNHQIAVVDESGYIHYVNDAWERFWRENGGRDNVDWIGLNYLKVFEGEDSDGQLNYIKQGILDVLNGSLSEFSIDYPCSSRSLIRYGNMCIKWLTHHTYTEGCLFLVTHSDITERKTTELKISQLAITDPLTQLHNRRYFNERVSEEWQACIRSKSYMSVILVDIDCFKSYNDNFGHLRGDDCISAVAQVIKRYARRPTDLAVRYGGEEFLLMLGGAEVEHARKIADSLRSEIRALNMPHPDGKVVTVSCGVASHLPANGGTYLDLLNLADLHLYKAKRNGKDQTEFVCVQKAG